MKKSRFTVEQIAYVLRQAGAGTPVEDVCRGLGISEAIFYVWKKKYASLGVSELRKLRQLEAENARLKRLVADLTLDKHILQEVIVTCPRLRYQLAVRKAQVARLKDPVAFALFEPVKRGELRRRYAPQGTVRPVLVVVPGGHPNSRTLSTCRGA